MIEILRERFAKKCSFVCHVQKFPLSLIFRRTLYGLIGLTATAALVPALPNELSPTANEDIAVYFLRSNVDRAPPFMMARTKTKYFDPQALGYNITESILNPFEAHMTDERVGQQVSAALYDARTAGAKTVRWIVTGVWPQWGCSVDPEQQDSGEIDPAWYRVLDILMKEAERFEMKVVVCLVYFANGDFAFPSEQKSGIYDKIDQWARHRETARGLYSKDLICKVRPGYYGLNTQKEMFQNPEGYIHFKHRFKQMSRALANYSALGAIEMFNEPDFEVTRSYDYWNTVKNLRQDIINTDQRLRDIPIISGTASWDGGIAAMAVKTGELQKEAFITVHTYENTDFSAEKIKKDLTQLIFYLKRLAPDKPIIFAEAGGGKPILSLEIHRLLSKVFMEVFLREKIGIWLWGTWFSQPIESDYKFSFNNRSKAASSLSNYFYYFPDDYTDISKADQSMPIHKDKKNLAVIAQITDEFEDTLRSLRWTIALGEDKFISFARGGALPKLLSEVDIRLSPLAPALYIGDSEFDRKWLEIIAHADDWEVKMYHCVNETLNDESVVTPPYLIGLALDQKRNDFKDCRSSKILKILKIRKTDVSFILPR